MLMLSFDLGDFNRLSAWCSLDTESGVIERGTVHTRPEELSRHLRKLKPDVVLCEACSMSYLLADVVCEDLPGAKFIAASTNEEAWRWSNTKRKTDASDAERLIRLYRLGELVAVALPDRKMRTLRRTLAFRKSLIKKRTSSYNAIRFACKQHNISLPCAEKAWSELGLAELEARCKDIGERRTLDLDWDTTWLYELHTHLALIRDLNQALKTIERSIHSWLKESPDAKRLQTAPGIGPLVAAAILAFIGDPKRFRRGKDVAAYAGLVPRVYQSGNSCRHGRITKAGNRLLRTLLINAAWQALRHNKWAQDLFARVCGGSKSRRKIAIVAVARHLLIRCWAMMRDQVDWQDPEPEDQMLAA